MRKLIRHMEVWAGLVSAVVLIAGRVLLGIPLPVAFGVAVLLYMGLYLMGAYWTEIEIGRESRGLTRERVMAKIQQGQEVLQVIRRKAADIPDPGIRDQIRRICDTGDLIFQNFEEDPTDAARSSRFLLYLERLLPLIERYTRLSATRAGRELLTRSSDDREFRQMLDTVEQGFNQGLKNYLEGDVMELRTFGRVLKKMMNVAEIGK